MDVFDLAGPLPRGTALLEASAGTGKTFAIGALVTRYVAEGVVPLDEMLVVTFGRAATQELRDRGRGALPRAERALAAAPPGGGRGRLSARRGARGHVRPGRDPGAARPRARRPATRRARRRRGARGRRPRGGRAGRRGARRAARRRRRGAGGPAPAPGGRAR